MQLEIGESVRHGDIFLTKVAELPKTAKPLPTNVVAEGEMTGHKHEFTSGSVQLYADAEKSDVSYVEVKSDQAQITHQEHRPLDVDAGVYIVSVEQEYEPFTEELRKVAD